MAKQRFSASVTLESDSSAPATFRETFEAGSPQKAASLAIRGARKAMPGRRYTSIVVVLEKERHAD